MMYLQKSFTVPAAPLKITACEACVYARGMHEDWCERWCKFCGPWARGPLDEWGYCQGCVEGMERTAGD